MNCTEVANGPFVAVEIGGGTKATTDAGPITGYALGWMEGVASSGLGVSKNTSSWNFRNAIRVDPQARVLGDGFVANQPPLGRGNCGSLQNGAALWGHAALVVQFLEPNDRHAFKPSPGVIAGAFSLASQIAAGRLSSDRKSVLNR